MSCADLFDLDYLAYKLEAGIALDEEEIQVVASVLRTGPRASSKREQIRSRRRFIAHWVATQIGLGMSNKQAVGLAMDSFSASRSAIMECLSAEREMYEETRERTRAIADTALSLDFTPTYVVQT